MSKCILETQRISVLLCAFWLSLQAGCSKSPDFQPWQPPDATKSSPLKAAKTIINGLEAGNECELAAGEEMLIILTLKSDQAFTPVEKEVLKTMPCIDVTFRATSDEGKMHEVVRGIAAFESFVNDRTVEFTADFVTPNRKGKLLVEILRNHVVPDEKSGTVGFKFDARETETISRLKLTLK